MTSFVKIAHSYDEKVTFLLILKIDKELSKFPMFLVFEQKTKVKKSFLVISAGLIFSTLILFNIGGKLLTDLLGYVYPA